MFCFFFTVLLLDEIATSRLGTQALVRPAVPAADLRSILRPRSACTLASHCASKPAPSCRNRRLHLIQPHGCVGGCNRGVRPVQHVHVCLFLPLMPSVKCPYGMLCMTSDTNLHSCVRCRGCNGLKLFAASARGYILNSLSLQPWATCTLKSRMPSQDAGLKSHAHQMQCIRPEATDQPPECLV